MKKGILFWSILLFFLLLFIYAIAAINQNSNSIIAIIATKITYVTTYPAKIFNQTTGLKLNGFYLTLNFILVSTVLAFVLTKITTRKR